MVLPIVAAFVRAPADLDCSSPCSQHPRCRARSGNRFGEPIHRCTWCSAAGQRPDRRIRERRDPGWRTTRRLVGSPEHDDADHVARRRRRPAIRCRPVVDLAVELQRPPFVDRAGADVVDAQGQDAVDVVGIDRPSAATIVTAADAGRSRRGVLDRVEPSPGTRRSFDPATSRTPRARDRCAVEMATTAAGATVDLAGAGARPRRRGRRSARRRRRARADSDTWLRTAARLRLDRDHGRTDAGRGVRRRSRRRRPTQSRQARARPGRADAPAVDPADRVERSQHEDRQRRHGDRRGEPADRHRSVRHERPTNRLFDDEMEAAATMPAAATLRATRPQPSTSRRGPRCQDQDHRPVDEVDRVAGDADHRQRTPASARRETIRDEQRHHQHGADEREGGVSAAQQPRWVVVVGERDARRWRRARSAPAGGSQRRAPVERGRDAGAGGSPGHIRRGSRCRACRCRTRAGTAGR